MTLLTMLGDRPYLVLGLGRSGLAAVRALVAAGRNVWAWDDNEDVREQAGRAGLPIVDPRERDLGEAAAVILSPGIPHTFPVPHPLVERARARGVEIIGDIELLFRADPQARYVGITGTNGKSTTTALIGHILRLAGVVCEVGGNLGVPVLEFRQLGALGVYVLELSSYQLELTPSLVLDVAVLLNITPDHLDRHGGFDGYVAAKKLIFRRSGRPTTAVVAVDDAPCAAIADALSTVEGVTVVRVSASRPLQRGVFAQAGTVFDALSDTEPVGVVDLTQAEALPGAHNAQNAVAAYAATRAIGVARGTIVEAIRSFPGLAHRQERIARRGGVRFINDSKATNPEATAKALACYRSIYWIAGGRPKEGGLAALEPYLERIRHAFLIGEAAPRFAAALAGKVPLSQMGTLDRAVSAASHLADEEQLEDAVVLLSPACASFDQFRNFEERGEAFRALVESLVR